ncbi:glutamine synthetase [Streptomyces sp. GC420]|nr:glutamine synthetase family protein [Streptomyces sp. GC420]NBM15662.1 glutamine synthetase [Streptomyces sp. GC420]
MEAARVRVVALTWTDNAGIVRAKAVPVARLEAAARFGVGMSPCFDVYTSADLMTASEHLGGPDGDLRLFPDLGRLVPLAAQPGWAWAPVDRYDQTGRPHPGCQRRFARTMQERAAAQGIGLRMGFETEWVVATPGLEPPSTGPAYGMTRIVELSDYLRDIAAALAAQHIEVLQIHPEYTAGQFEVSTAPAAGPVGAADDVVLVRETVRAVTARHGWRASFAPRFTAGTVGNGSHLHFSLDGMHRDPRGRYGLAPEAESFLAGVLDRLPALTAVANPSPASALRLVPSHWAGAYRCWGVENREAALRLVPGDPADPDGGHAEYKCADAAANPYLLAGSVIAAGLAGVAEGARLPEPVAGDPAGRPGAERLPSGLGEAADHFAGAEFLKEAMGEVLHGAFLAVRRAEDAAAEGRTAEEITDDTRWRY